MEPGLKEGLYKLMDRSMMFLSKVDNATFKAFWQGYQCIIISCISKITSNINIWEWLKFHSITIKNSIKSHKLVPDNYWDRGELAAIEAINKLRKENPTIR